MNAVFSVYLPTFFVVSITPGLCMVLALSLGMSIGIKKTYWMILGELLGLSCVVIFSALGALTILHTIPQLFFWIRLLGGAYLCFIGLQMLRSKGSISAPTKQMKREQLKAWLLISQGYTTAIFNPKGWIFFGTFIPQFIDFNAPLPYQLLVLIGVTLVVEFFCISLYAFGGKSLRSFLSHKASLQTIQRIAGILIIGVGIWLMGAD